MTMQPIAVTLQQLNSYYHRLLLVVGPPASGKTRTLRAWQQVLNAPYINLNLALSRRLLELPARQRPAQAQDLLRELLGGADPLLLDNIELLFDPALQLDPLRALKAASRSRRLVVAWPGSLERGSLIYAEPGHGEYRRYAPDDIADLIVVDVTRLRREE